jgi:NAD(P)-dependent dehydrogenase (short-subunit alcohol dehydrogenase family)
MQDRGGSIVLVGSVLATHPVPSLFATHAYAAVKGAATSLATTLASYYAPRGIRVNVLAPGLVDTPMAARAAEDPEILAYSARKQPLAGGMIDPDDVARAAVFLLSDDSSQITGQVIAVDGGWSVTAT